MDGISKILDAVIVGIFFCLIMFIGIYQIQVNHNVHLLNNIATRQTLTMDNVKSQIDQGYYTKSREFMKTRDRQGSIVFLNSYDGLSKKEYLNKSGHEDIKADPVLGIPTDGNPYEYGQPYGFYNDQYFYWRSILNSSNNPPKLKIHEAKSGVNRGNFGEGYTYKGFKSDRHVDRNQNFTK